MKTCPHCNKEIRWQNNRLNEILNVRYKHDFSLCDIDGVALKLHSLNKRLIIFETKNARERISNSQLTTLRTIEESINWKGFDRFSGVYILQLVDIENDIRWFNTSRRVVRRTTIDELYLIFSKNETNNNNS